jgi:hypothetical protein
LSESLHFKDKDTAVSSCLGCNTSSTLEIHSLVLPYNT